MIVIPLVFDRGPSFYPSSEIAMLRHSPIDHDLGLIASRRSSRTHVPLLKDRWLQVLFVGEGKVPPRRRSSFGGSPPTDADRSRRVTGILGRNAQDADLRLVRRRPGHLDGHGERAPLVTGSCSTAVDLSRPHEFVIVSTETSCLVAFLQRGRRDPTW